MNSESLNGFTERLKLALGDESARSLAMRAGISQTGLAKTLRGESEPNLSTLNAIAKAANVSIGWLATGEGPMRPSEQPVAAERPSSPGWPETDGRFLGRIAERISKVYQEVGAHIGLGQLTELAARHHDSIIALADDDEQREQLLVMALTKLRRELTSGTPSSKRRA
jgi:transcriptional regulator with XRE-family HTH domain